MKKQVCGILALGVIAVVSLAGCNKEPELTTQDIQQAQKANAAADARVQSRPELRGGAVPSGTSGGERERRR